MLKRNIIYTGAFLFVASVTILSVVANAQIVPPSGINAPSSQKFTLQQICDRLETGANPERMSSFTGPSSGPTGSSMCSLNELMAFAPSLDEGSGATASEVLIGRTFWGLRTDGWGQLKGEGCSAGMSCTIKTGQTTSYIDGDDGDTQRGATVDPRLTANGDGTVTDNLTGLVWLQDSACFISQNWASALSSAASLASGSCGLSDGSVGGDWRLPNVVELESLQEIDESDLLPTGNPFSNLSSSSLYRTSTTCADDDSTAWTVQFSFNASSPVIDCPVKSADSVFYRALPVR